MDGTSWWSLTRSISSFGSISIHLDESLSSSYLGPWKGDKTLLLLSSRALPQESTFLGILTPKMTYGTRWGVKVWFILASANLNQHSYPKFKQPWATSLRQKTFLRHLLFDIYSGAPRLIYHHDLLHLVGHVPNTFLETRPTLVIWTLPFWKRRTRTQPTLPLGSQSSQKVSSVKGLKLLVHGLHRSTKLKLSPRRSEPYCACRSYTITRNGSKKRLIIEKRIGLAENLINSTRLWI